MTRLLLRCAATLALLFGFAGSAWAGAIFLTGHDPDFHAEFPSGNVAGARNFNNRAIDFITDPLFNPFSAGGTNKFLFVESKISAPSGHRNGVVGITQSGYTPGTDFEHHDATTLAGELSLLGTKYDAIVIASDFGGVLTQAELDILNANSTGIIDFINAGGGLYAMAESNSRAQLTPGGGQYGYLPFVVASSALNQPEVGNVVTAFGASLGITNADVNGNASHAIFGGTFGLQIVDVDSSGNILSLAGRGQVDPGTGILAEPAPLTLLGVALLGAGLAARRRRRASARPAQA